MVKNIRGNPTYRRNMCRWIWSPEKQEIDLFRIANRFGKDFIPSALLGDVDVKKIKTWTELGPSASLHVKILSEFQLRVECYRDGWHVSLLHYSKDLKPNLKESVFGDFNKNQVWTNETEKVSQLMGQVYNELKKYLEENK